MKKTKAAKATTTPRETVADTVKRVAEQTDWRTIHQAPTPERGVALFVEQMGIEPHRLGMLEDGRYFVCDSHDRYEFRDLRHAMTFMVYALLSECRFCIENMIGDLGVEIGDEHGLPILSRAVSFECEERLRITDEMIGDLNAA